MTVLQQLLLIPLLAPLLAVLMLAALNPRPAVALRVLVWTAPAVPLGAWIAAAVAGGAGLSAGATVLALRQGEQLAPGRTRQRRRQPVSGPEAGFSNPEFNSPGIRNPGFSSPGFSSAGPTRAPGEPAPTVEVPFRVIRKAKGETGTTAAPAAAAAAADQGDDWNQALADAWD